MATSLGQLSVQEPDRLSDLPEPLILQILSFLPTKFAVRTSLLCRRFRHLWAASPSIDLERDDFPPGRIFVTVTNRCLRLRDKSAPLRRLRLKAPYSVHTKFPIKSLTKWLVSATSQGLKDLMLNIHQETIEALFPLILSFHSLESLSLDLIYEYVDYRFVKVIPEIFDLVNLKSLHVSARMRMNELNRLITKQRNLECLSYHAICISDVNLSSPTVKMLKLSSCRIACFSRVNLSFPSLEFLDLDMDFRKTKSPVFHGDMPLLRKATVKVSHLYEQGTPVFGDLFESITNVEELNLHIEVYSTERSIPVAGRKRKGKVDEYPFRVLVQTGKDLPTFPNLKRLRISMCFHDFSIEDLVCLIHNSPVLESLQLVHVIYTESSTSNKSDRWISKLPLNSEGNNEHAYFADLHIGDNKAELVEKLLCNLQLSKKQKMF